MGLFCDFQEAVKNEISAKFTLTTKHWHALMSIAYRVLITWTGQPKGEGWTNQHETSMNESVGRLAKALHRLTIYPYDDDDEQTVYVWLLLSPNGTKVTKDNIELFVKQVVVEGVHEISTIFIHFGLHGLHFIFTDSHGKNSFEKLISACCDQQYVISLEPNIDLIYHTRSLHGAVKL